MRRRVAVGAEGVVEEAEGVVRREADADEQEGVVEEEHRGMRGRGDGAHTRRRRRRRRSWTQGAGKGRAIRPYVSVRVGGRGLNKQVFFGGFHNQNQILFSGKCEIMFE